MERTIPSLLWLLFLYAVTTAVASAQQPASPFGTHFVIAFPDTTTNLIHWTNNLRKTECQIVVYARKRTDVRVRSTLTNADFTVDPATPHVLKVEPSFVDRPNTISLNVFDIQSDEPVMLYCYYTTSYGSEAFTPLPVSSWGKEYRPMGFTAQYIVQINYNLDEEDFGWRVAPAEVVIVASKKSSVTIEKKLFNDSIVRVELQQ